MRVARMKGTCEPSPEISVLPDAEPDSSLMARIAAGDMAAFEQLIRRHQSPAWSLAYRFIGDPVEAEDIVQKAFMNIYEAASRYRPTAKFRTYLFLIVANLCRNHRSKRREQPTDNLPQITDPSASADQLVLENERSAAIRRVLEALPANQRLVVLLRYFEELRYEEIAEVMWTSEKAVDSLLQRARRSLQSHLAVWK